jgi:hypothetical protein
MNGAIKFHKPTVPAFLPGEVWYSVASRTRVTIIEAWKHPGADGDHVSDYSVRYAADDGTMFDKDAWNFQVRYTHAADLGIKEVSQGRS